MYDRGVARTVLLLLTAPVLIMAASSATPPHRMFPAFTMIRGPGIDSVVLIHHARVRDTTLASGLRVAMLNDDPLALIYEGLEPVALPHPDSLQRLASFDVAEFYGPEWTGLADPTGKPKRPIHWDEANHYSTIYVAGGGRPPIWDNPVVGPGGAPWPYFTVGDSAVAILARAGVRLR